MPETERGNSGRLRRVDATEILEGALEGLDEVPGALANELLEELGRADGDRVQRIQQAIEAAARE